MQKKNTYENAYVIMIRELLLKKAKNNCIATYLYRDLKQISIQFRDLFFGIDEMCCFARERIGKNILRRGTRMDFSFSCAFFFFQKGILLRRSTRRRLPFL